MRFEVQAYGDPASETLLVQMVDDHDLESIHQEMEDIRTLTGGKAFCLKAVKANSWSQDLTPWPAPAVFGGEDFGAGAADTLAFLLNEVLPVPEETEAKQILIGGYSLAGLFALWAGYETDVFDGIAAASPSVWYPSFAGYMREHRIRADAVYLSLGDREERTRDPILSQVGDAIRAGFARLREDGTDCVLEWNKGNHFQEPALRTAKAFAWLMNRRQ